MSNISLTKMAITFLTVTLIFTVFLVNYGESEIAGFELDGFDNSSISGLADNDRTNTYITNVSGSLESLQADTTKADIIGTLIAISLAPVRIFIGGVNFMITGVGAMINIVVPGSKMFSDFIVGSMTLITLSILLFSIILGRKDKND